ncbi:MAG TPA: hypothetical protein VGN70_04355 [Gammaproteobacteria bacterium]
MIRRVMALLALVSLAACATVPKPAAIKEVATADQGQYWLVDHDSLPADLPAEDACVRVKAIIADGKIVDPKILAVVGPGIDAWLPGFLKQLRFYPAPTNPTSMPIRTVLTWTLTRSVTSETVPAQNAQAAMQAMANAPPEQGWGDKCKAEMDQQMGIAPAPAAVTAAHPR